MRPAESNVLKPFILASTAALAAKSILHAFSS